MGHEKRFKDIHVDMRVWLDAGKLAFFTKSLQVEKTYTPGWLLYSTPNMQASLLSEAITAAMKFPVAVRWRTISVEGK